MELPLYFRLAPELRRCAYYVLAASVPLAGIPFCVSYLSGEGITARTVLSSAVLCLLGAAMILPLRWTLRIDEQGVARRRLLGWDLWTWDEFASGRIEKRYQLIFLDPQRPFWRRKLSLGYMASRDIEFAMERINAHYRLPDAPEIPAFLMLYYGFRRHARLDANGIQLQTARDNKQYLWRNVSRVHIVRTDPLRRDFQSLEINLPDESIKLRMISHQGGTSPSWKGASAELVNEFILKHAPEDRVDVDLAFQPRAKRCDVERQLSDLHSSMKGMRRCVWLFAPPLLGILIWMAVQDGVLKAVVMAVFCAMPVVPLFIGLNLRLRTRYKELENQLAVFDHQEERATNRAEDAEVPA